MQQVFVDARQVNDEIVTIQGEDARHLGRVVRIRPGEEVRVSVRGGRDYYGHVLTVDREEMTVKLVEEAASTELAQKICLFQAIPKGDRMETVIEKAVELGVYEIVPVETRYCVVRLDEKKKTKKRERWQAIAANAARQSKRSIIPRIAPVTPYQKALDDAGDADLVLLPYENASGMQATGEALKAVAHAGGIGIFIGPEGGFAADEIKAAQRKDNIRVISLGRRILRTDTAAIAAMTMVMMACESR